MSLTRVDRRERERERDRTPEVLTGRTYGSVASNIATGSFSAVAM